MRGDVLITGATGTLGHRVVGEATEAGHKVRALSRKPHVGYTGVHWAQGDLLSGDGIDAALDGVDTVIHCATQGTRDKDVVSAGQPHRRRAPGWYRPTSSTCRSSASTASRCPITRPSCGSSKHWTASGLGHTIFARHPIPRPHRDDLLDPAILACADRDQGCALPAHRHPRCRGPPRVPDRRRRRGSRRRHRRACSRSTTTSWAACTSFPATAVDACCRCQCPVRIVAALKSGANLVPANPVGTIGFAEYLARTKVILPVPCSPALRRRLDH